MMAAHFFRAFIGGRRGSLAFILELLVDLLRASGPLAEVGKSGDR